MKWILLIVIVIVVGVLFVFIAAIAKYLIMFHCRRCKHCGHIMEYRGEKERKEGNIFLFQCPNCGAWDEVPVIEFERQLSSTYYE